jgi:hypothetical protein
MYNFGFDIKVAEKIEQIYNLKELDGSFTDKDVETAFNLWEYYVNPIKYYGKDLDNWTKFDEYFKKMFPNWEAGQVLSQADRAKISFQVIKEVFDYDYFKQRLDFHKKHEDKECMREWFYKLDTNQLKQLLPEILGFGAIFLTQNTIENFCKRFNDACIKNCGIDFKIKRVYDDKCGGYRINNLNKIFSLERIQILDMFCNCIDNEDKGIISSLAYVMCFGGIEDVCETLSEWSCD